MEQLFEILQAVSVPNRDNGQRFTDDTRLRAIAELLRGSDYRLLSQEGLFHLYGKQEVWEHRENAIVVSAHVDVHDDISRCFAITDYEDGYHLGTFDNAITNAAAVYAMLNANLPDNVFFAFTGDEECESAGAVGLTKYLCDCFVKFRCVVLDVTDMGWEVRADCSVENNFWSDTVGKLVVSVLREAQVRWTFVPEDPRDIPDYIPRQNLVAEEAEPDESWDYDEEDVECFSFCLPCAGPMHSDRGVRVRSDGFASYTKVLIRLLNALAQMPGM